MAKSKKSKSKGSKPSVKVADLKPRKDPKGGYDLKISSVNKIGATGIKGETSLTSPTGLKYYK